VRRYKLMGPKGYRLQRACSSCNRAQVIRTVELGVGCGGWDLNHRPLGYELVGNCKFNYFAAQMTTHGAA